MKTVKLDLPTLKHVKFMFELHSDHSTGCHGYKSLCRLIEQETNSFEQLKINSKNPTKDFPEDFPYDNGFYYHICHRCHQEFYGYKKRLLCKECETKKEIES
jgi:hypothetical protein